MSTLLKCPICGGTERSLLPSSVCEECGCDMKPVECYCGHPENPGTHSPGCFAPDGKRYTRPAEEYLIAEARRVLFDKSQPKEARMAAMNVLQPKPTARQGGEAEDTDEPPTCHNCGKQNIVIGCLSCGTSAAATPEDIAALSARPAAGDGDKSAQMHKDGRDKTPELHKEPEPDAWLHSVTQGDDGPADYALSFSPDSFPLSGELGFRSLGSVPLYTHPPVAKGDDFAVRLTRCCGREECGGECGNQWQGMEWVRKDYETPIGSHELLRLLPGAWYMDPPDGGDVSLLEQLRRMADDARKWREHEAAPPAREGVPEYTRAMGEAAEKYLQSVAFNGMHHMPARFHWSELWVAMLAAAPTAGEGSKDAL